MKAAIFVVAVATAFALPAASLHAQQPAKQERSNKSGEVRGKERADQVKQMNGEKSSKGDAKKSQGKAEKKS